MTKKKNNKTKFINKHQKIQRMISKYKIFNRKYKLRKIKAKNN